LGHPVKPRQIVRIYLVMGLFVIMEIAHVAQQVIMMEKRVVRNSIKRILSNNTEFI
jgi:hypothetical protein